MVDERVASVRLTVKTENGNFVNSNISHLAENAEIYELAETVNSLQNDTYSEIVKTVTTQLQAYT